MANSRQFLSRLFIIGTSLLAFGSQAGEDGHWGYSGHSGPEHWGEVSEDFSVCSEGRNQSPIDIVAPVQGELPAIELKYSGDTTEVVNNGHAIVVKVSPGSVLVAEGVESELLQFHFHSPSENKIKGEQFPLEVHFVHKSASGDLSALAVMFRSGSAEADLSSIWANLPATGGQSKPLALSMAKLGFIPSDLAYFRFNGSLTTPPCSEGVRWYVLESPSTVSPEQVASFLAIVGENARPQQPLNARIVIQ
jgi:carbonic anhydrase